MKKNITNSDYHSHKALGSSAIKLVPQSLAKFKAYIDGELFHETSALKFGQLIHEVILEDGLNTLAVGPDADKRTKVWKDFVAKNDGKQIVTPKEFETLRQMHKSLYDNKNCSLVLKGGEAEQSFFWEHDNIEYKARPDYYVQRDQGDYIVDYKSITGSDFSDIQRTMGKYAYDIQAAHYIRVVSECTGRPVRDYVWIFQEKEAPYESVVVKPQLKC